MQHVRRLTKLKVFSVPIRGSKLTGASLENLKGLTGLRGILLTNLPCPTDADLAHLKGLIGLQELQFPGSPADEITDAGLANLEDMADMRGSDHHRSPGDVRRPGPPAPHDPAGSPLDAREPGRRPGTDPSSDDG